MTLNKLDSKQDIKLQELLDTSLAVDIGTEFTKTSAGILFRSTVRRVSKHSPETLPCVFNVIYNNNLYVVGDLNGDKILSSNNCSSEEYKICLLTAIALSTLNNGRLKTDIKIRLALGLPAKYYDIRSSELTKTILKMSDETITIQHSYTPPLQKFYSQYPQFRFFRASECKSCKVKILDHNIFMQGATLCDEYKIFFDYPLILLDLGSKSINISLWDINNGKIHLSKFNTYENLGFHKIIDKFVDIINILENSGPEYDKSEIIEILEGDIIPLDNSLLEQIKDKILTPYICDLSSLLKNFDIHNCKDIRLLGCPATTILNYFASKHLATNSKLPENINPKFANAILFNKRYKELLTKEFISLNRKKLYTLAYKNTPKNSEGKAIIPKDDEWVSEDAWENHPTYSKED